MPNAITSLKRDHGRLKKLLSDLERTTERGAKTRTRLLDELEMELKIHAKLEEEIFYPAFKEAASKRDDRQLFYEATEEHHVVDMVMPELRATSPTSEVFGAKAKVVKELVEHHMKEEENDMFVKARALMSAQALNELGAALDARRETMVAQWENPVTGALKRVQSAVEKFVPTAVKNAKAVVSPYRRKGAESARERRP